MATKNKAICICIAHNYPHFDRRFTISLLQMINYFHDWEARHKQKYTLSVLVQDGYQLDWMRNEVTEKALDTKHDILLYLDTDMIFPIETIPMLLMDLEANPTFDSVSGLYHNTRQPHIPHIFSHWDERTTSYACIYSGFPTKKPFPIAAAGLGILMVKKEVFTKPRPWFKFVKTGENKEIPLGLGEDLYFAWYLKPKMMCDPRLQAGHFLETIITTEDFKTYNKAKIADDHIVISKTQLKRMDKMRGKTIILKD